MEPIFSPTLQHQLKIEAERQQQRIKERQARDCNCSVGRSTPVPFASGGIMIEDRGEFVLPSFGPVGGVPVNVFSEKEALAIAESIGRCVPGQLCESRGHGSKEWCADCGKTSNI